MLIKIIKNNIESEWFELTKAQHRALLEDQPEAAIVKIEELYPGSPDKGTLVQLDFALFTVLAREFVLEENRQKKQDERHIDPRPIEYLDLEAKLMCMPTMEDTYFHNELSRALNSAKQKLTPVQRRRLELHIGDGLSLQEIAVKEGVLKNAVFCSINHAKEKIKNFLE